jgi:hypothetical protein
MSSTRLDPHDGLGIGGEVHRRPRLLTVPSSVDQPMLLPDSRRRTQHVSLLGNLEGLEAAHITTDRTGGCLRSHHAQARPR